MDSNIDKSYDYSDIFDNKHTDQLSNFENKNEDCDILWGLESCIKYQKLTIDQINIIKRLIDNKDMNIYKNGFKYCASYSILRRIKQFNENQIKSISTRKINWIYGSNRKEVIMLINKYL